MIPRILLHESRIAHHGIVAGLRLNGLRRVMNTVTAVLYQLIRSRLSIRRSGCIGRWCGLCKRPWRGADILGLAEGVLRGGLKQKPPIDDRRSRCVLGDYVVAVNLAWVGLGIGANAIDE